MDNTRPIFNGLACAAAQAIVTLKASATNPRDLMNFIVRSSSTFAFQPELQATNQPMPAISAHHAQYVTRRTTSILQNQIRHDRNAPSYRLITRRRASAYTGL